MLETWSSEQPHGLETDGPGTNRHARDSELIDAALAKLRPLLEHRALAEDHVHAAVTAVGLPARLYSTLLARLAETGVVVAEDPAEIDDEDNDEGFDQDGLSTFLDKTARHRLLTPAEERRLADTISEGILAENWLESDRVPAEALADLRRQARAGMLARDEFARCNMKLVVSIAARLQGRGMDLEDLIQEGYLGLSTAVVKFDGDRGLKFSTYATWWIRQAMHRAIANKAAAIRLPVHMHDRVVWYARELRRLFSELGRLPTDTELARRLEITTSELNDVRRASSLKPASLDRPLGDRLRAGDIVADRTVASPEESAEVAAMGEAVRASVGELNEREREVIGYRFGLTDGRVYTLEELGQTFGVTRERIRQVESKALVKLRGLTDCRGLREYVEDSRPRPQKESTESMDDDVSVEP